MFSTKGSGKVATPEAPRANGKATMPSIISQHLAVHGDLDSNGDIQVDGSIEGDVKTTTLTIGETGSIKGAIVAETVLVAGRVVGQVRAKTVSLARTARVQGDIWHDTLSIEGGAQFEGSCKRLSAAVEATTEAAATTKRAPADIATKEAVAAPARTH